MSENDDRGSDEIVSAVERYIDQMGWSRPDLPLTDVLVVAVRRGFDQLGSKSVTTMLVPTESAVPLLLGMSRYAQMRLEKMIVESFVDTEES